jgi:hypothetical protein
MPWEHERNRNSLSPHGLKEAEGHAARGVHDVNHVRGVEPPPGLTSMTPLNADPHGAGPKSNPYVPANSGRPVDEPQEMRPPHNPAPHRYAPATERQSVVLTPRTRP